jgi:3-hydroxyacyl-CoA dehydrogenase, NAD binding domain
MATQFVAALGVAGAGFMGSGIAEAAARAGVRVALYEPDERALARSLRALHEEVKAAKTAGEEGLDPWVLAGYRAAYQQIIAAGNDRCPLSTIKTGKRGVIGQSPARNLLTAGFSHPSCDRVPDRGDDRAGVVRRLARALPPSGLLQV